MPISIRDMTIGEIRSAYRKDLQLNRYRLEVASEEQATKFEKWYSVTEDVAADIEDKKAYLAEVKARVEVEIRSLPKQDLEKKYHVTDLKESVVKSLVELNPTVQKVSKELRKLKLLHNKLKGAVESGRQRKSMIRVLADLYQANYWDKTKIKQTGIDSIRRDKKGGGV
ncbi:MAG: hypothetical protein FVQ80_06650 [Planctomycetes bacterium]|nr:hypothetical protein [Planctomycetota bacterium]